MTTEEKKQIGKIVKGWLAQSKVTQTELATRLGIKQSSISQMLNGKIPVPIDRLKDIIRILSPTTNETSLLSELYFGEPLPAKRLMQRPELDNTIREQNDVEPLAKGEITMVPILSIVQAAGYEPALEPLCDYLRECSDEAAPFFAVKENYFALRVSGDSMAPDYPNGSIALIAAGEYPQRGDLVVAKLASGQVVMKEYHRKDNVVTLQSINPDGQTFTWHIKEDPCFAIWMWPVVEITIRPRDRRWAEQTVHNASKIEK